MGRKIKETFSELKRVTWPTFGKALKATGVVLVIVLIFTVIVTGINYGLVRTARSHGKHGGLTWQTSIPNRNGISFTPIPAMRPW